MDSITDKKTGVHSPMMQKRRSRALQISHEVIEELDDLRRKNLSRSPAGSRSLSQSQEFNTTGRSNVCRNQEVQSRARRNISQSQDFDSVRRVNLTRNQENDQRRITNLSRSQEFVRPSLAEPNEGFATRHSSETLRTVKMKDERRIALSKPDVVLRSPMLRAISGKERFVSSNATNIERRDKPLMQGQAQSAAEWKSTLPKAAGTMNVSLNLSSPERRSGKVLEPRVASAVAALSRLGEQRASMSRAVSERKAQVFQDQTSNLSKASYYSVSKIPANTSVVTENTQFIVPHDHMQDGRKLSTVKNQTDHRSFSASTTATCGLKEQRAAMTSSTSEALFQRKACKNSSTPQDICSQGMLSNLQRGNFALIK